jgi:hypothetical protein
MSEEKPMREVAMVRASDVKLSLPEVADNYGGWSVDREELYLTLSADSPSGYEYNIPLESMSTSGEMLDMIMQIAGKTWATPEMLGHMVMAMDAIFEPQANLCSWGTQMRILNAEAFLRKRLRRHGDGTT